VEDSPEVESREVEEEEVAEVTGDRERRVGAGARGMEQTSLTWSTALPTAGMLGFPHTLRCCSEHLWIQVRVAPPALWGWWKTAGFRPVEWY